MYDCEASLQMVSRSARKHCCCGFHSHVRAGTIAVRECFQVVVLWALIFRSSAVAFGFPSSPGDLFIDEEGTRGPEKERVPLAPFVAASIC